MSDDNGNSVDEGVKGVSHIGGAAQGHTVTTDIDPAELDGLVYLDFDRIAEEEKTEHLARELIRFKDGSYLIVRELLGHERGTLEDSVKEFNDKTGIERTRTRDLRERALMMGAVRLDGSPAYPHRSKDEAKSSMQKIGHMKAYKLDKGSERVLRMSGIGKDEQEKIEAD